MRGLNLSPVNAAITKWVFKHTLVKRAHPKEHLVAMVAASPFRVCEVHESPIGYEVVMRKPAVR